jgi:protein phosphatase
MDKDHLWHLAEVGRLAEPGDRIMVATAHHLVDLADPGSADAVVERPTAGGGEGMVVKPRDVIARGRKGLVQPAVNAAGRSTCASSMGRSTTPLSIWPACAVEAQ